MSIQQDEAALFEGADSAEDFDAVFKVVSGLFVFLNRSLSINLASLVKLILRNPHIRNKKYIYSNHSD